MTIAATQSSTASGTAAAVGSASSRGSAGVALVTGAAKRIGRAIALELAASGWAVGIHHRSSAEEAQNLAKTIEANGGRAACFPANLCQEAEVERLLPAVTRALGPVTLLVNNASLFEHDAAHTATRESWDRHMEANLRAPFVLIQDMARLLPESLSGNVINLLDERVWSLTPHFLSYTLSKAGLWTLTRTLAMALAPRIRVNGIGPGPALPSARQSPEQFARQAQSMPLGRGTSPEEIARAVLFLVGSESVTGQMLALDGGQHLGYAQPAGGGPHNLTPEE